MFGGVPQKVLDLIESRGFEVAGVLSRKFDWARAEIVQFLPPLWDRCIVVTPTKRLSVSRDPDDNRVLECAEAAGANFLVTGNTKHFPKHYKTTAVITAREFLELLA